MSQAVAVICLRCDYQWIISVCMCAYMFVLFTQIKTTLNSVNTYLLKTSTIEMLYLQSRRLYQIAENSRYIHLTWISLFQIYPTNINICIYIHSTTFSLAMA